ncbi:DUF998 domain-containing protein [Salinimicrobium sp. HB62]|uniref:DUF998 domain-containing protein n=1 Tax=Salinimicrobium sp. HB62 TaxID=3077781 RepID=UPI002D798D10|nr:DUF998 domain-containing protein [Salinimicrobium sp. HB62]
MKYQYSISGAIGIFGCFAVIATDVIGIALHEAHDPIADTISMLAIGKYGWIQDLGLDLLAVGFAGLATGLYFLKRKGTKWLISLGICLLIAVDIILIAEHNQYAGRPGFTIHRKLVYTLALLFPALLFTISAGLQKIKPFLKKFSRRVAVLWLIFAPLLPFIPDSFDGAYERLVSSLIVIWLGTVSYQLYRASGSKV